MEEILIRGVAGGVALVLIFDIIRMVQLAPWRRNKAGRKGV